MLFDFVFCTHIQHFFTILPTAHSLQYLHTFYFEVHYTLFYLYLPTYSALHVAVACSRVVSWLASRNSESEVVLSNQPSAIHCSIALDTKSTVPLHFFLDRTTPFTSFITTITIIPPHQLILYLPISTVSTILLLLGFGCV